MSIHEPPSTTTIHCLITGSKITLLMLDSPGSCEPRLRSNCTPLTCASIEDDGDVSLLATESALQTPELRPLLPTCPSPTYLYAAMTAAKSLFRNIFRVTPSRSAAFARFSLNPLKTRSFGGGGEGGTTNHLK